jgi:hypothetical protein
MLNFEERRFMRACETFRSMNNTHAKIRRADHRALIMWKFRTPFAR